MPEPTEPNQTPEPSEPAVTPTPSPKGDKNMENAVLSALGLPEHADSATVIAAIKAKDAEIAALKTEAETLKASASQVQTLAAEVASLQAASRKAEIDRILTEEERSMRVLPGEREHLAEMFAENPDGLKALVNARPPAMFAHLGDPNGVGGEIAQDASLRKLNAKMGDDNYSVDADSGRLHIAAEEILAKRGKAPGTYTEDEYAAALAEASQQGSLV